MNLNQEIKERGNVALEDCWNLEVMYRNWEDWESDFNFWARPGKSIRWPEMEESQFNLKNSLDVKKMLDLFMEFDQKLGRVRAYAHLKHDEDVSEELAKKAHILATDACHAFFEETSWIESSVLQLPSADLEKLLREEVLKDYRVYLEKIIRLKPHTLDREGERLLAFSGKMQGTSQRVFSALNNADLKFPPCLDENGVPYELTHGTYHLYLKGKDRTLRKSAFYHLHETFALYENTLCELIQGQVQRSLFEMKARHYSSCLEAYLYPNQIDPKVYFMLIKTAKSNLSMLHQYLALRKKHLGYSKLHLYDLNVSLVEEIDIQMTYEEAVEEIIDSVSVLGEEYQAILRKGLIEDRWVDRYENKRKRSGAYSSSGGYRGMPYILMNYKGTLSDVMTLAHEAGHSMHTYFSAKHQNYQDSHYSIFVAEVASTFHEELLFQSLLKKIKTKKERAYLINQKIDGIRATFFRQVLFAEFELALHEWVEKGVPLTPALLKETYLRLNKEYLGEAVELDAQVSSEWSRIPHFYSSFYVYQYATGISAACALAKDVLQGRQEAREKYIEFISSGSSRDPLFVLKRAGVDMTTEAPVCSLMAYFQELVLQLEKNLEEK